MAVEDNHIEACFKDELNDFQLIPPAEVWEKIEKELNRKKRILGITIWTSLAASVALLIGLGLYMFQPDHTVITVYQSPVNTSHNLTGKTTVPKYDLSSADSVVRQTTEKNTGTTKRSENITLNYMKPQNRGIIVKNNPLYGDNPVKTTTSAKINPEITINRDASVGGNTTDFKQSPLANNNSQIEITKTNNLTHLRIVPRNAIIPNNYAMVHINQDRTQVKQPAPPVVAYDATNPFHEDIIPDVPKVKRWSIEGQVAPLYSYRNFTGSGVDEAKSYFNSTETGMVSYAGMVKINYQVTSRLSVQSGVSYAVLGYANNDINVISESAIDKNPVLSALQPSSKATYQVNISAGRIISKTGTSNKNTVIQMNNSSYYVGFAATEENTVAQNNSTDIQQFQFVEIPFTARYKLIDSHISLHLLGGVSSNVLVSSNNYLKVGNDVSKYGALHDLKSFNYSSTIGFGIGYKVTPKMQLIIEPTYKYFINSISNNGYGIHPYTIGVYTGLNFSF